jgi:uncharacterized LabA/DUF88 family protein
VRRNFVLGEVDNRRVSTNVNVYIDGFNLYFGALKSRPDLKWLNLRAFAEQLYPDCEIGNVYYFTAEVLRQDEEDLAPKRQVAYLKVLADSGVQIVKGHFSLRNKHLRLVGEASSEAQTVNVWQHEEKGSDVNLAAYLLRDVYVSGVTHALVISGDSDLANALHFAREAGTHISLAIPNRHENGSAKLKASADYVQFVKSAQLEASQFPKAVQIASGREIVRPNEWT